MKRQKRVAILLLALLSVVLIFEGQGRFAAVAARAQDAQTYKITGVVLDPNGARIVGATIKVENGDFRRKVISNDEGYFEIELPAGAYHLTAEASYFEKFKLSPFYVKAGASEFLEIHMKVKPPTHPIPVTD